MKRRKRKEKKRVSIKTATRTKKQCPHLRVGKKMMTTPMKKTTPFANARSYIGRFYSFLQSGVSCKTTTKGKSDI
jgi:hypothetical protein